MVSVFQPIVNQMQKKAKRYLITTAISEIFIIPLNRLQAVRGFCAECAAESEFFTLDEAVSFSGESTRRIFCRIEAGAIHVLEAESGHLLVCRNSLSDFYL